MWSTQPTLGDPRRGGTLVWMSMVSLFTRGGWKRVVGGDW